jgi:hypothetical protein
VVPERRRGGVARELDIGVEEEARGLRGAEPLEMHREERDVIEPVEVAEAVVEVETVQQPRAVVETEDVVGQ